MDFNKCINSYFKLIILLVSFVFLNQNVIAQTGIGTTTPEPSAKLDVSSTNKGFLPPRIALTGTLDVVTIASPATGLVIYNTSTAGSTPNNVLPGYYYYDGGKWNGLVDQSALQSFSGYVPNYAQSSASSVTKSVAGDIIFSQSITTSGRPVQIIATGDANPTPSAGWVQLQLYRDGTAIGKKVQAESSSANENVPYCLNFIDHPTAGTYTYSVRYVTGSGSFQFGEADGNQITLLELGAWSAGTMPVSKGGTGNSSYTTGSLLFSDGTNITQNNSKLFWDNSNNRLGVGNNAPTSTLDVTGNVNVRGKINVTDASGNLVTKTSGIINTGSFVQLDNVKVGPTRNGAGGSMAGLSIGAVSTSFVADISATYSNSNIGGSTATSVTYSTAAANSAFGWGFGQGNQSTYILNDITNSRVYRIILMIGASYNNNFISIERLY